MDSHLLIDVSILDCTDPHILIVIFLVGVLVRVVCGIVGLHLGQRRADVAGGEKIKGNYYWQPMISSQRVFEASNLVLS